MKKFRVNDKTYVTVKCKLPVKVIDWINHEREYFRLHVGEIREFKISGLYAYVKALNDAGVIEYDEMFIILRYVYDGLYEDDEED